MITCVSRAQLTGIESHAALSAGSHPPLSTVRPF